MERGYIVEPEKKHIAVRKWLTYITLFIAGLTLAGDLVTVLYFFLDGQELTAGFLLKILSVLIITAMVFAYYISDIRGKLTGTYRKIWLIVSVLLIVASIVWGFIILGSPRTQQLLKYDQQKINDLQNINNGVMTYYSIKGSIPEKLSDISTVVNYFTAPVDSQTNQSYEYILVGQSAKAYQLCATFNKESQINKVGSTPVYNNSSWTHPAGRYCFNEAIPLNQYVKPVPVL